MHEIAWIEREGGVPVQVRVRIDNNYRAGGVRVRIDKNHRAGGTGGPVSSSSSSTTIIIIEPGGGPVRVRVQIDNNYRAGGGPVRVRVRIGD